MVVWWPKAKHLPDRRKQDHARRATHALHLELAGINIRRRRSCRTWS